MKKSIEKLIVKHLRYLTLIVESLEDSLKKKKEEQLNLAIEILYKEGLCNF